MASLNKVTLIGNLGKDPEIRYTQDGRPIARFSLATNEQWKDPSTGEMTKETEWHRIVVFGKQAEIAGEYLKKGKQVYVEGAIKTREYKDKDGNQRYITEIKSFRFLMLGRAGDAPAPGPSPSSAPTASEPDKGYAEDDIPF